MSKLRWRLSLASFEVMNYIVQNRFLVKRHWKMYIYVNTLTCPVHGLSPLELQPFPLS